MARLAQRAAALVLGTAVYAQNVESEGGDWLQQLHLSKRLLTRAFSSEEADIMLANEGFNILKHVAAFVQEVKSNDYSPVLLDSLGRARYELTEEDEQAVSEFINQHMFVLIDALTLVLLEPSAFVDYLEEDERQPKLLHRIIAELRGPFYDIMILKNTWTWGVPLFGALALFSEQLRAPQEPFQADPYRKLLWSREQRHHLRVLGEPLVTAEYDRRSAYKRACAHLAIEDSRASIEEAERHSVV
eukprot:TRINITY_DN13484_c0_g1_i5.p1 TRINITY_DN13484_c0_g1~~TRINITY_DN13484_c0_g1_i5.p1  ORF type:complete len:271 (+),score=46.42 TRINITY_DN13484_c0_g1_i5:80-814(+)